MPSHIKQHSQSDLKKCFGLFEQNTVRALLIYESLIHFLRNPSEQQSIAKELFEANVSLQMAQINY